MMNKLYKIAKMGLVSANLGDMVINTRTALNKDEILGPWEIITEVDNVAYLSRTGTALVRQDEKIPLDVNGQVTQCWGEILFRESKRRFSNGNESSCSLSFNAIPNTIRE